MLNEKKDELEYYPPPDKRERPNIPLVESKAAKGALRTTPKYRYIEGLINQVSEENIRGWVEELSAFHTRHSKSPFIDKVADTIAKRFKEIGYADLVHHKYTRNGYQLENIICTKPGPCCNGPTVIVCAHYDCVMEDGDDATSRAPGADDNATGIAVLMELARILVNSKLEYSLQFAAFSGEEQGLWGSAAYAQYVKANNINVHRLINLDMLGYPDEKGTLLIEKDMGNRVPSNDAQSEEFAEIMAQVAANYTNLPVKFGPIYSSDYMPFEARGYVVIGAFEGGENPNYHTAEDTPNKLNYRYTVDIARAVLATVLYEIAGEDAEPTQNA